VAFAMHVTSDNSVETVGAKTNEELQVAVGDPELASREVWSWGLASRWAGSWICASRRGRVSSWPPLRRPTSTSRRSRRGTVRRKHRSGST